MRRIEWRLEEKRVVLQRLLIIGVVVVVATASVTSAPTSHCADETLRDKALLVLQALEEAINNPTEYNLMVLSESGVKVVAGVETWLNVVWDSCRYQSAKIRLDLVGSIDDGNVLATLDLGYLAVADTIQIDFSPGLIKFIPDYRGEDSDAIRFESTSEWNERFGSISLSNRYCPTFDADLALVQLSSFIQRASRQIESYVGSQNSVVRIVGAEKTLQSNGLYHPRYLYDSYTRFNGDVSRAEFDGHLIYSSVTTAFGMEYDDPWDWLDHRFVQTLDADWHRVIGSSQNPGRSGELHWFQASGTYGSGSLCFKHPCDIAYVSMNWFVVDRYNDVIKVYSLDWDDGTLSMVDEFSGLDDPVSVDAARFPVNNDPINDYWQVAVLDREAGNIKIFDLSGDLTRTLSLYSSDPTSLCFARNCVTHYKMPYLYVLDNEEKRILGMSTIGSGATVITEPGLFPADAWLTSVCSDAYGNIYVTDKQNSVIYVFRSMELIATWGLGPGTSDQQLYYGSTTHVAEGWYYDESGRNVPKVLGDVLATEVFHNSTGIRRFVLGFDILGYELSYMPQPYCGGGDRVMIEWEVSGTTASRRRVWADGDLVDDTWNEVNVPGSHYHQYWLQDDSPDSCWYTFEVYSQSKYDTSISNTLRDSIYVVRYEDPGPHVVINGAGTIDMTGDIPDYCGVHGGDTSKVWTAWVDAVDNWHDSNLVYYWSHHSCLAMAEDTTFDSVWTYFVNDRPEMFFKVRCSPFDVPVDGLYRQLFEVMISTDEYDPLKSWTEYEWLDTLSIMDWYYRLSCQMTCTDDCPPVDHGCPTLYMAGVDGEYRLIDNILPQAAGKTFVNVTDPYAVGSVHAAELYQLRIQEDEHEITHLDRVELYLADVFDDADVNLTTDGRVCMSSGDAVNPISAITHADEDVTDLLVAEDGNVFSSVGAGYLDLCYDVANSQIALAGPTPPDKMVMKPTADGIGSTITVCAVDSSGRYVAVQTLGPRINGCMDLIVLDEFVIDHGLQLRLYWSNGICVDHLPYATYSETGAELASATLNWAVHSVHGDVTSILKNTDQQRCIIGPSEHVDLTFRCEGAIDATERIALFRSTGWYETISDRTLQPVTFALSQNYPNPFNPKTTLSFSIPRKGNVTLNIYNVLGQKVKCLINGEYEAGSYEVSWDGKDDRGKEVASGVLFATLKTGDLVSTRKMVMLK